jgi:hypothetical protein
MKSRKVPYAESGQRLARVIDTVAGGSLKQFEGRLRTQPVTRGTNHRYLIDYRKGRRQIPGAVIARVCQVYPSIQADYLRGETQYMTADDERDARERGQRLSAAATGAATGDIAVGQVFSVTGHHRRVRESVAELERLTPGGAVARSPLHEVWHRLCAIERVPLGPRQLTRLARLVRQVDGLLPAVGRPSGLPLEVFRLGILAAMLAALDDAHPPRLGI